MPAKYNILVAGKIDDNGFQQARVVARYLASENSLVSIECREFVEADWEEFLRLKTKEIGGAAYSHKFSPLVLCNDTEYIGMAPQFIGWVQREFDMSFRPNAVLYTRMAHRAYKNMLTSSKNDFAYMDIAVAGGKPERVVFELFTEKCPTTCENFVALCTGSKGKSKSGLKLNYAGTPFHRVVKGGWIQGGDIAGGHGDGGESVFGPTFADECFSIKHDRPGILAMANDGGPHSNGSQFYISLRAMPWMDTKAVAFGRVISGMRTVRLVERQPCENQRPTVDCHVVAAGVFDAKVYGTAAAGAGAYTESKSSSEDYGSVLRTVFNQVDTEGSGTVGGRTLAKRIKVNASALQNHFTAEGVVVLIRLLRSLGKTVSYEQFMSESEELYRAVHGKVGVAEFARKRGLPNDPFGVDKRSAAEQRRCMDLRRPATKKKLLRKIFADTDVSGDNLVSKSELLGALRRPDSLLVKHFPKHVAEIPKWIESGTTDEMTWTEFFTVASRALSKPGGRSKQKVADPLGVDDRSMEEKVKHMDLRRPKTKKKLLKQIFAEIDTSGDQLVSRDELLASLKKDDSPLKKYFPKHLHDVPRWMEACVKDSKLTYEQFHAVAWPAINSAARG